MTVFYFQPGTVEELATVFFIFPFQTFLNPVLYDLSYQVVGNWCVKGELDRAPGLVIRGQLFKEHGRLFPDRRFNKCLYRIGRGDHLIGMC